MLMFFKLVSILIHMTNGTVFHAKKWKILNSETLIKNFLA